MEIKSIQGMMQLKTGELAWLLASSGYQADRQRKGA